MGVIKTNTRFTLPGQRFFFFFFANLDKGIKPSLSINLNGRLSFLFPSRDGKGHEGMTKMAVMPCDVIYFNTSGSRY